MSPIIIISVLYFALQIHALIHPNNTRRVNRPWMPKTLVRKVVNKDQPRETSFSDWENWKTNFPQCDPEKNPHVTPVIINSNSASSGSDLKPIVVHGGLPNEKCLYLSMVHIDNEVEMEVVNIFPDAVCQQAVTYISGGVDGRRDYRYFRKALLLFSSSEVDPPRSLHQLDGKSYQMEIAMEFADKNGTKVTEIHLMVEVLPSGETSMNPAFKSIEDALTELKSKIEKEKSGQTERSRKYKKLKSNCENAEKTYFESIDQQMPGGETESSKLIDRYHELETASVKLKFINDDDLKLLIKMVDDERKAPVQKQIELVEKKMEPLINRRNNLTKLAQENEEKVEELKDEFRDVSIQLQGLHKNLTKLKRLLKKYKTMSPEKALNRTRSVLRKHNINVANGIITEGTKVGGNKSEGSKSLRLEFESPNALYEERDKILENLRSVVKAEYNYLEACGKYVKFRPSPYAFVPMEGPLQISWLFPYSGYYWYEGSNPIPPCEPRTQTIVFDTPIRITTEQFQLFQNLPSLSESSGSADKMVPVIHSNAASHQRILHVKKNPVFTEDDGYHIAHHRMKKFGLIGGIASDNLTASSISRLRFPNILFNLVLAFLQINFRKMIFVK